MCEQHRRNNFFFLLYHFPIITLAQVINKSPDPPSTGRFFNREFQIGLVKKKSFFLLNTSVDSF